MNTDHTIRTIDTAASDLTTIKTHAPAAIRNLIDQRRGLPGSGFGGGGGNGGSSSPVERALGLGTNDDHLSDAELNDSGFTMRRDLAQARLDEIEAILSTVSGPLHRLRSLMVGNAPHAPSDKQRRSVEAVNEHRLLCEHCTKHRPKGDENDVHATGDVGGRLKPQSLGLCSWCYDFVRRYDRLPFKADVERNVQGLRAMVKA